MFICVHPCPQRRKRPGKKHNDLSFEEAYWHDEQAYWRAFWGFELFWGGEGIPAVFSEIIQGQIAWQDYQEDHCQNVLCQDLTPAVHRKAHPTSHRASRHQVEILEKCHEDSALVDLMAIAGRSDRTKFRHQVSNPLLELGLIEMTIPDKPRSSKQKYRLTEKGRQFMDGLHGGDKWPTL